MEYLSMKELHAALTEAGFGARDESGKLVDPIVVYGISSDDQEGADCERLILFLRVGKRVIHVEVASAEEFPSVG